MRFLAVLLALIGGLGVGTAHALTVLDGRGLAQGGLIFGSSSADFAIDVPAGLLGVYVSVGSPLLALDATTAAPGDPFEAADFSLFLEDQSNFDFLDYLGADLAESTGRIDLLFERFDSSGVFAGLSQFLLVTIAGDLGAGLGAGSQASGQVTVQVFETIAATPIPLPASLFPLLAGVGVLVLLRRRA